MAAIAEEVREVLHPITSVDQGEQGRSADPDWGLEPGVLVYSSLVTALWRMGPIPRLGSTVELALLMEVWMSWPHPSSAMGGVSKEGSPAFPPLPVGNGLSGPEVRRASVPHPSPRLQYSGESSLYLTWAAQKN